MFTPVLRPIMTFKVWKYSLLPGLRHGGCSWGGALWPLLQHGAVLLCWQQDHGWGRGSLTSITQLIALEAWCTVSNLRSMTNLWSEVLSELRTEPLEIPLTWTMSRGPRSSWCFPPDFSLFILVRLIRIRWKRFLDMLSLESRLGKKKEIFHSTSC